MTVKVVTDSASDIPVQLVQELGITVVPIYIAFGEKCYRDGVDIAENEFYDRLALNSVFPTTSVPSPKDFADVYNRLADETDEIISIHVTSKESGTYNSALLGKELVDKECRIEVVDSLSVSMGLGLMVIAAAREALSGASLEQIAEVVRRSISRMHILILVDTLKYVIKGGRLSKPHGFLGSVLRVKPLLALRDGDIVLSSVARTKEMAMERMHEFARGFTNVREIAVAYTTIYDEALDFTNRLKEAFPDVPIYLARVGPSLGTHAGPGAMGIGIREW